jgi:hypothetical protein
MLLVGFAHPGFPPSTVTAAQLTRIGAEQGERRPAPNPLVLLLHEGQLLFNTSKSP